MADDNENLPAASGENMPDGERGYRVFTLEKQDEFVSALSESTTIHEACAKAQVDYRTVWNYFSEKGQNYDPDFAERFIEARRTMDARAVQAVEMSLVRRLLDPDAAVSAALYTFYLVNRAPERWKHAGKFEMEHSGRVEVAFGHITEMQARAILEQGESDGEEA